LGSINLGALLVPPNLLSKDVFHCSTIVEISSVLKEIALGFLATKSEVTIPCSKLSA